MRGEGVKRRGGDTEIFHLFSPSPSLPLILSILSKEMHLHELNEYRVIGGH